MSNKSENLNSNSILRLYKQNMMLKFMEVKSNEPNLTQKQISKQLGYSDSTIKRYRDDIQMDSPYNRNKYRKKTNKSNTPITQTNTKREKIFKKKKKNDIKRGSILENDQKNNTKFVTLARKMVDNV